MVQCQLKCWKSRSSTFSCGIVLVCQAYTPHGRWQSIVTSGTDEGDADM